METKANRKKFIKLYTNGYHNREISALLKSGLVNSLKHNNAHLVLERTLAAPEVKKAIDKFEKQQEKIRKTVIGKDEASIIMSNVIRDCSTYGEDGCMRDINGLVKAFEKLAQVMDWNSPVKTVNENIEVVVDKKAVDKAEKRLSEMGCGYE